MAVKLDPNKLHAIINKYGNFGVPDGGIFIDRAMVIWNPNSNILYADGKTVGVEGE